MVTYKFLVDWERCIRCGGCEVACKQQNDVPIGIRRIRVVTINEGKPGEKNVPMPCMHCASPPCLAACPTKAIYQRDDGIVLVDKDKCIGCGYCSWACPFGAPQFLRGVFGLKGKMDKCTYCVLPFEGGAERAPKPKCAGFCSTKALLAGDAEYINAIYRTRKAGRA
ncbi:MAG: 4Fe-4S dicluster domain-containing protein [Methanocellales archaeon]|nr:4Fe-4S dicluster domain-containing protein [Methanocellales archaeon]